MLKEYIDQNSNDFIDSLVEIFKTSGVNFYAEEKGVVSIDNILITKEAFLRFTDPDYIQTSVRFYIDRGVVGVPYPLLTVGFELREGESVGVTEIKTFMLGENDYFTLFKKFIDSIIDVSYSKTLLEKFKKQKEFDEHQRYNTKDLIKKETLNGMQKWIMKYHCGE